MRKIKGKSTKSSRKECRTENPYLWLEDFELQVCNNGDWKWEHGVFGREKMNSHKYSRENWKRFKNRSYFCQTRDFRDLIESPHSRQSKPPKHTRTKFWKNFLSVFRDWKVYPRVSRELSRENLWVNLATGPSTREQVAKNDQQRCDWGSRLDIPATEPPKQGKTGFLKFSDFSNKILSKNT